MTRFHGTTILGVRKNGRVALGGDGQVSIGETVVKSHSNKVRALKGGLLPVQLPGVKDVAELALRPDGRASFLRALAHVEQARAA